MQYSEWVPQTHLWLSVAALAAEMSSIDVPASRKKYLSSLISLFSVSNIRKMSSEELLLSQCFCSAPAKTACEYFHTLFTLHVDHSCLVFESQYSNQVLCNSKSEVLFWGNIFIFMQYCYFNTGKYYTSNSYFMCKTHNYHQQLLNMNQKHYWYMTLYKRTVFRGPCHISDHLINSTKTTVNISYCYI